MESASEPRVSRYGINGNRGYLNIKRSISRLPSPVAERILHSENFSLKLDHERNSSPHSEDKSSLLRERCCKLRFVLCENIGISSFVYLRLQSILKFRNCLIESFNKLYILF